MLTFEEGEKVTEYQLFPDIKLIVSAADNIACDNAIEISYCVDGICEYKTDSGYYYVSGGKYFICDHRNEVQRSLSSDHSGITVLIDPCCGSKAFDGVIDMPGILKKLQDREQCVFNADDSIKRMFSDIYDEMEISNITMLRIKVLELLMLMSGSRNSVCDKSRKIRKAGSFICQNPTEHYTISQLSELFKVDVTTLKILFRQIFGCPVYTYTKNRKMFYAAALIRDTEMKIIDIAEEVGYSNASKFSKAFRDVMGTAPKKYQMEHKKSEKYQKCHISA